MPEDEIEYLADAIGYVRTHARLFFGETRPGHAEVVGSVIDEALFRGAGAVTVASSGGVSSLVIGLRCRCDYHVSLNEFRELTPQPRRGFRAHGALIMVRAFSTTVLTRGPDRVWFEVAEAAVGDNRLDDVAACSVGVASVVADLESVAPMSQGRDIVFVWPK